MQKKGAVFSDSKKQLKIVDSLLLAGKSDTNKLILQARSKINTSSPAIVSYYSLLAGSAYLSAEKGELYADSALLFFNSGQRTSEYPNEYFKSLLVKGDACFRAKKYIAALNYYYKGKKVLSSTSCDDGSLDTKMGNIYYKQKKFKLAARCWAESYNLVQLCNNTNTISRVYEIKQAALNNAGLSYERAGNLDSAKYFYLKDIKLLKEADSIKILARPIINQAIVSLYDNLGGLYMATNNLTKAKDYLDKAVAMDISVVDGIKIPPLIKLAQLYLENGDNTKAAKVFSESRQLLNRFANENIESAIKWNKLYAAYLYKLKQADKAYLYQEKYITLVDSARNSWAELSRVDVERELNSIRQRQALTELEEKEKTGTIYVVCSVIIGCLFVVIILLIYRNLKREKKNNKNTAAHNQQLQQAMDELERVNKNYIRMMRVMAHDLRNPLSGMKSLAAILLEESEFSEENKHLLRLIETTGMHTMDMINELLRSGLAHENEEIQQQTVDLRSLLYDVVELLQFRASEKKQSFVFESDGLPVETDVNRENMWRVFNNLIVNAIKFSQAGSTIRIGIKTDKKKVRIFVADNGIGIPDKDKDLVFEMFTAAKKAGTNGEEAFGLGLSISKSIVENHNGKIWFENNPGGGTVFYIELPVKGV